MFLYLPMLLGFNNATVKYCPETSDFNIHSRIISITYIFVMILTSISILIFFFFSSPISKIFLISEEIFYFAIIFAVFFVIFILTSTTLNGLHKMKNYAFFQSLNCFIILIIFLIFIAFEKFSYKSMVYPILISNGIIGLIIFIFYIEKIHKIKYRYKD